MIHEAEEKDRSEKGYIQGEILYTIFHNETEHFSIAKFVIHQTNEEIDEKEIVGKGYFTNLQEGTTYTFYGHFEYHPKFGKQYAIKAYETYIPSSREGIVSYLSSDLFYGIGKKTAEKIVDHLGDSAISKLLNDPSVAENIPGLHIDKGKNLVKTLQENQGFEHVVIYLARYGIGLKMCHKIYEAYKDEAIDILRNDPYQYVFDIEGFGFQTADVIAKKNGLSLIHPNRIGGGCIYVLQQSIKNGHVFLPLEECVEKAMRLLETSELTEQLVKEQLKALNKAKTIVLMKGNVYLASLYYSEDGFASHLERILSEPVQTETDLATMMKITGEIEEDEVLSYGEEQFTAINHSIHNKVLIVTGGPGTGKTTVIKGILSAYATIYDLSLDEDTYDDKHDFPFVLTAPTGRAAKRLKESTGIPAVTIHRLLGWNGNDKFDKDETNQLSGKIIIIDEFSMVDIWLANSLFKAIPTDMQVLLVGDEDQLPSVGPGQVLADLLESKVIPFVKLTEVYRQKEGSKIIQLAHQIKNDQCRKAELQNAEDFSFIPCKEHQIIDAVKKIFLKANDKGIDLKDIQILAPMYRSRAGITSINEQIQQVVNPKTKGKREVKTKDAVFRVGDKVIQLVNQPEDGVSNGDIGEIVAIFREDENKENVEQLVVSFDDKETVYERKDYINIMHAYCISIHKAQGSEFPIVIMPVVSTFRRMLRKNLLYTGITRGKKSLIICGEINAFLTGVQTIEASIRYTSLVAQLTERIEERKDTTEETEEEISPYDFM